MAKRSITSANWSPALIETARIVNVNVKDWTVDVLTTPPGNKPYFDIEVMSPYFHFANGEGIYCMPEVGALVWVCKPTDGVFARPFILGFQAPYDMNSKGYRNGRQALNPGDIMLRTRDENFVILRRGGVVQIGSTPACQRIFIPIRNYIKDFCENYELNTFGGELTWHTDRTDQTTTEDAPTRFTLKAKQLANNPGQVAALTIGSHGKDDPTILKLDIFASGLTDAQQVISMVLDNAGTVSWTLEKDWNVTTKGNINFESTDGNLSMKATKGTAEFRSYGAMGLRSDNGAVNIQAKGNVTEKSAGHIIDAPEVKLGGAGAAHPVPYGDQLNAFLKSLIAAITTAAGALPAPGGFVGGPLVAQLDTLLSTVTKTM